MLADNLYPYAGNNAIRSCAFGVEWAGEATRQELDNIRAVATTLFSEQGLPKVESVKGLKVDVKPDGTTVTEDLPGLLFFGEDGYGKQRTRQLQVTSNQCSFTIHKYSHWKEVKPAALALLSAVLTRTPGRQLRSVVLEYHDAFVWRGPKDQFTASIALRDGSRWVVPAIFKHRGTLWHSHTGYFGASGRSWGGRRLDNVNVALNEENPDSRLVLNLLISHKFLTIEAGGEPAREELCTKVLPSMFEEAHDMNKRLMREVITDEVARLIDL